MVDLNWRQVVRDDKIMLDNEIFKPFTSVSNKDWCLFYLQKNNIKVTKNNGKSSIKNRLHML